MSYVDGYVLPIPKNKIEAYKKIAEASAIIWKEHGALEYRECIADDIAANEFCSNFIDLTKLSADETVVFAWILYPSREARDEINQKVFNDPRLHDICKPEDSPFDPKRMAYGGFTTIVHV